jgi:hypothetical protein
VFVSWLKNSRKIDFVNRFFSDSADFPQNSGQVKTPILRAMQEAGEVEFDSGGHLFLSFYLHSTTRPRKSKIFFQFFLLFIFMTVSKLARFVNHVFHKLLNVKGLRRAAGRAAVSR